MTDAMTKLRELHAKATPEQHIPARDDDDDFVIARALDELKAARVVVEAARKWRDATEVANQNPGMLLSSQRTSDEAAKAMSDMFTAEECVYVAIAAFDALTRKAGS